MSITKEIQNEFDSIDKRVFILSLLVDDYIFLFKEKTTIANQYSFIRRTKDAIACYMIHDFYKLLHPDEKASYLKFLNKVIHNFKRIKWKSSVELDYLKSLKNEFETKVYSLTYNRIINLRDKICSHFDKQIEKDVPTFNDFKYFVDLIKKLHSDLCYNLFNQYRDFDISDHHRADFVLDRLKKYDKLRNLIQTEKHNKKENISINVLLKYI
jgi:hypothetical protein